MTGSGAFIDKSEGIIYSAAAMTGTVTSREEHGCNVQACEYRIQSGIEALESLLEATWCEREALRTERLSLGSALRIVRYRERGEDCKVIDAGAAFDEEPIFCWDAAGYIAWAASGNIDVAFLWAWDYRRAGLGILDASFGKKFLGRPILDAILIDRFESYEKIVRKAKAEQKLKTTDLKTCVAGSVLEALSGPGEDDGCLRLNGICAVGRRHLQDELPEWATAKTQDRRWGKIKAAVKDTLVDEVFGKGIHSPRSKREFVSYSAPARTPNDGPDSRSYAIPGKVTVEAATAWMVDWNDREDDLIAQLDSDRLLNAAFLTTREREILSRYNDGETEEEISRSLEVTQKTVNQVRQKAKEKIRNHLSQVTPNSTPKV